MSSRLPLPDVDEEDGLDITDPIMGGPPVASRLPPRALSPPNGYGGADDFDLAQDDEEYDPLASSSNGKRVRKAASDRQPVWAGIDDFDDEAVQRAIDESIRSELLPSGRSKRRNAPAASDIDEDEDGDAQEPPSMALDPSKDKRKLSDDEDEEDAYIWNGGKYDTLQQERNAKIHGEPIMRIAQVQRVLAKFGIGNAKIMGIVASHAEPKDFVVSIDFFWTRNFAPPFPRRFTITLECEPIDQTDYVTYNHHRMDLTLGRAQDAHGVNRVVRDTSMPMLEAFRHDTSEERGEEQYLDPSAFRPNYRVKLVSSFPPNSPEALDYWKALRDDAFAATNDALVSVYGATNPKRMEQDQRDIEKLHRMFVTAEGLFKNAYVYVYQDKPMIIVPEVDANVEGTRSFFLRIYDIGTVDRMTVKANITIEALNRKLFDEDARHTLVRYFGLACNVRSYFKAYTLPPKEYTGPINARYSLNESYQERAKNAYLKYKADKKDKRKVRPKFDQSEFAKAASKNGGLPPPLPGDAKMVDYPLIERAQNPEAFRWRMKDIAFHRRMKPLFKGPLTAKQREQLKAILPESQETSTDEELILFVAKGGSFLRSSEDVDAFVKPPKSGRLIDGDQMRGWKQAHQDDYGVSKNDYKEMRYKVESHLLPFYRPLSSKERETLIKIIRDKQTQVMNERLDATADHDKARARNILEKSRVIIYDDTDDWLLFYWMDLLDVGIFSEWHLQNIQAIADGKIHRLGPAAIEGPKPIMTFPWRTTTPLWPHRFSPEAEQYLWEWFGRVSGITKIDKSVPLQLARHLAMAGIDFTTPEQAADYKNATAQAERRMKASKPLRPLTKEERAVIITFLIWPQVGIAMSVADYEAHNRLSDLELLIKFAETGNLITYKNIDNPGISKILDKAVHYQGPINSAANKNRRTWVVQFLAEKTGIEQKRISTGSLKACDYALILALQTDFDIVIRNDQDCANFKQIAKQYEDTWKRKKEEAARTGAPEPRVNPTVIALGHGFPTEDELYLARPFKDKFWLVAEEIRSMGYALDQDALFATGVLPIDPRAPPIQVAPPAAPQAAPGPRVFPRIVPTQPPLLLGPLVFPGAARYQGVLSAEVSNALIEWFESISGIRGYANAQNIADLCYVSGVPLTDADLARLGIQFIIEKANLFIRMEQRRLPREPPLSPVVRQVLSECFVEQPFPRPRRSVEQELQYPDLYFRIRARLLHARIPDASRPSIAEFFHQFYRVVQPLTVAQSAKLVNFLTVNGVVHPRGPGQVWDAPTLLRSVRRIGMPIVSRQDLDNLDQLISDYTNANHPPVRALPRQPNGVEKSQITEFYKSIYGVGFVDPPDWSIVFFKCGVVIRDEVDYAALPHIINMIKNCRAYVPSRVV